MKWFLANNNNNNNNNNDNNNYCECLGALFLYKLPICLYIPLIHSAQQYNIILLS